MPVLILNLINLNRYTLLHHECKCLSFDPGTTTGGKRRERGSF